MFSIDHLSRKNSNHHNQTCIPLLLISIHHADSSLSCIFNNHCQTMITNDKCILDLTFYRHIFSFFGIGFRRHDCNYSGSVRNHEIALSKKTSDSVTSPLTRTNASIYFDGKVRMSLIFVVTKKGLLVHENNIVREIMMVAIK